MSKFTYVEFYEARQDDNGPPSCAMSWRPSPIGIHTVLTDNGMAFADLPKIPRTGHRPLDGPHLRSRLPRDTASSTG